MLCGTVNTAILLTSSLFVAVAVKAAEAGLRRLVLRCLAVFFMELRASGQPVRLMALVGLVFIIVMFALTFTDVFRPRM